MEKIITTNYVNAGVDTEQEEVALKRIIQRFEKTWPTEGEIGTVKLPIGFFANVVDIGGIGLAITTDGVGTKVLIAQMMEKYDTIGIDCVAMNVNDLLCVGAKPITMVDYLAIQEVSPRLMDELAKGLAEGARIAHVSIPGGETAQLRDVVHGYPNRIAFDLAGTAVGTVALDQIIVGQNLREGDVLIGIESNGVHSNGLTLARQIFFEQNDFTVAHSFSALNCSLGEELLKPTYIYVDEALAILQQGIAVNAFIHITSDGFLNLTRVASPVGYVIEQLPPIPPIFSLIQRYGNVSDEEMFRVYNMGIGFCIVVSNHDADRVLSIVRSHQKRAYKIGSVVADPQRRVFIKPKDIVGKGKRFYKQSERG